MRPSIIYALPNLSNLCSAMHSMLMNTSPVVIKFYSLLLLLLLLLSILATYT